MTASVIVASYRRPEMLLRCLAGLLGQERLPDEIVVVTKTVDPASGQAVAQFVAERKPACPIRSVQVTELPIVAAENAGLHAASGDIAAFIDDDAVARPDWLGRLLGHYVDEQVGASGGRDVLTVDDQPYTAGQAERIGQVTWYGRLDGNHHLGTGTPRAVQLLKGVNMSVRRSLIGQIDRRLLGDVTYRWEDDLCLGLWARGYRVVYDPQAIVDHYAGRNTADRALESPKILYEVNHNITYVLLKHLPAWHKPIALAYTFLIGDGNAWGLVGVARQLMLGRRSPSFLLVLGPSLAGKLAGLGTYVRRALGAGWSS
jgi:GT2 family glycosyltransferase